MKYKLLFKLDEGGRNWCTFRWQNKVFQVFGFSMVVYEWNLDSYIVFHIVNAHSQDRDNWFNSSDYKKDSFSELHGSHELII